MKRLNELRRNEKGFTLIELIIVIAILAIIAAVAVPNIIGAVDNSRRSADVANAKIILNAAAQVEAKRENLNVATITLDDATIKAPTTAGQPANFGEALYEELNGSIPTPSFFGHASVEDVDEFRIVVATDGTISVNAVDTATGGTQSVEVAPNADETAYGQK